jgi:ribosomal protein S18 acetylase RimI-like enzyme
MKSFDYKINTATGEQIKNHLFLCSDSFSPHLDTYIDIPAYALKLRTNSVTFESWYYKELVGLIACYLNDENSQMGYITNVSVNKEFYGLGIAKKLLENTIQLAKEKKFEYMKLEVRKDNFVAIKLYKIFNFIIETEIDNKYIMKIILLNE